MKMSALAEIGRRRELFLRWDRFGSVDEALASQMRCIRVGRGPRPFGEKAHLKVLPMKMGPGSSALRVWSRVGLLQLSVFIWLNGLAGLRRWVMVRKSPVGFVKRWRLRRKLKRLYGEVPGGCR